MKLDVEIRPDQVRQLQQIAQRNSEGASRSARLIGIGLIILAGALVFVGLQLRSANPVRR